LVVGSATTHQSGALGAVQGDAIRDITCQFGSIDGGSPMQSGVFTMVGPADVNHATASNYDLELRKGYQGHSASAGLGISF
jgi:hypothetical protein